MERGPVTDFGETKQVTPGMEGDEVNSDTNQRGSQGEKKDQEQGFAPLGPSRPGGEGQEQR